MRIVATARFIDIENQIPDERRQLDGGMYPAPQPTYATMPFKTSPIPVAENIDPSLTMPGIQTFGVLTPPKENTYNQLEEMITVLPTRHTTAPQERARQLAAMSQPNTQAPRKILLGDRFPGLKFGDRSNSNPFLTSLPDNQPPEIIGSTSLMRNQMMSSYSCRPFWGDDREYH